MLILTILSGSLAVAMQFAQYYVPAPRYIPQSRSPAYDWEYPGPGREPSVVHPAEQDWERAMRRFRIERDYRGPYRGR